MLGLKICDKCGNRHGRGRRCIDIYQQVGQTKGPPVVGKVLLAFVLPLLVFIVSLVLASYFLSNFVAGDKRNALSSFLAALAVTVVFVQLIRVFTRKPITTEDDVNN